MENKPTPQSEEFANGDAARCLLAFVCSHLAAPYGAARFFVRYRLGGGFDWGYGIFSAAFILLGAWLAYGRFRSQNAQRRICYATIAIVLWFVVSVSLLSIASDSAIPLWQLAAIWAVGNLWVAWLVWGNSFYRWRGFLIGLSLCICGAALQWATLEVTGLTGDARVEFSWRRAEVSEVPGESPENSHIASLGRITWRGYLGKNRDADVADTQLNDDWANHPPEEIWRVDCGRGWSSFASTETTLFGQEQLNGIDHVVARNVKTGNVFWISTNSSPGFQSTMGGDGPRATPTLAEISTPDGPVLAVFAVGPTCGVECLNAASGERIWSQDLAQRFPGENLEHGVCGSPLLLDDLIVVCPPAPGGPCAVALNVADGRIIWTAKSDIRSSYASPQLMTLADAEQIVLHTAVGAVGIDQQDGSVLWKFDFTNEWNNNATQVLKLPSSQHEIVISTGYKGGAARVRVTKKDGVLSASEVWRTHSTLRTKFCNLTLFGDLLVSLDNGIMVGVDANTGRRTWKRGRYGHGQLLKVGKHLLVVEEFGSLRLLQPDSSGPNELGKYEVLSGKTWNHPILVGDRFYVRNDREIVCLRLALK